MPLSGEELRNQQSMKAALLRIKDKAENDDLKQAADSYFKQHGTYDGFFNAPPPVDPAPMPQPAGTLFPSPSPQSLDKLRDVSDGFNDRFSKVKRFLKP